MWKFAGEVECSCDECNNIENLLFEDFDIEIVDSHPRQMGAEVTYQLLFNYGCAQCQNSINLDLQCL